MADKKIVDDYYSQIDSGNKKTENQAKKTRIIKKKIKVKKPTPALEETKVVKKDEKKTEGRKVIKPKKIIQKIEVVEGKTPAKKFVRKNNGEEWKKTFNKKGKTFNNRNNQFNNRKKITVKKRTDQDKKDDAKKAEVKFKIRWQGQGQDKKRFNDNKPAQNNNNKKSYDKEERLKKSKLAGQRKTRWKVDFNRREENTFVRSNKTHKKQEKKVEDIKQNLVEKKWETVVVPEILSLKELSEKIWVMLPQLMAEFMKNGMMVNINSKIDFDSASIVAEAFEVTLEKDSSKWASVEDIIAWDVTDLIKEEDSSKLQARSPVISIMWHVDHGKTSLLDHIRQAKVASGEAWGITQSIWAYQVEMEAWKITFLDTPWHEAFTVMRARWAKSTDIAILVVAADEWVKPQTIESINHAREAWIPVIVAINKMDKQWANPDHVKWQLAEHWLTPEDWGGDTPMVPVSAHTGFWINDLLEIILLVAEMQELKANPDRRWIATIIESHLDHKLWPVATVLVNTWTVNMWDHMVCQDSMWKIKVLKDYKNHSIKKALPWEPILIVWLDKVVNWGDIMQIVKSGEVAKQKVEDYRTILEKQKREGQSSLALLMSKIKAGSLKQLKIILKADTNGSLEAIKWSLLKLSTPETTVQVIHAWVGAITEWDILMGQWSEAILVWFNVWVLPTAKNTLESSWVEYISSDIIYHITERIEKIITWMLDPKEVEIELTQAKVAGVFFTGKDFMIVWLQIPEDTKIENKALVRILRNKKKVWVWTVDSLKSWTLEVKELEWPIECWIKLKTKIKVELWDALSVYKIEIQK